VEIMAEVCPKCDGMGMVVVRRADGRFAAEPCDCRFEIRISTLMKRAQIPKRYEHCIFDNYHPDFPGADPSLAPAKMMGQQFVDGYPATTEGKGLLFVGSIGVGKTHLAVSILRALINEKAAQGLFCDYRELLKQIQHSYNPQVATTELEILRPVFEAEVLVLDELGAAKPTDWVWDTVALILNTRYNDKRTTIITSNFPDGPPCGTTSTATQRAMRDETLGDRIGERMRSRLAEMCVPIQMNGADFRKGVGRARFG
jgi:DNA replication protein DnaC